MNLKPPFLQLPINQASYAVYYLLITNQGVTPRFYMRQKYIEAIPDTKPTAYTQISRPYTGGKGRPDATPRKKPDAGQATTQASTYRNSILPLFAVMVATKRPMLTSEIVNEVKKYTGEEFRPGRVQCAMSRYFSQGWIKKGKSNLVGGKFKTYQLTSDFFISNQHRRAQIEGAIPKLEEELKALFNRIYADPNQAPTRPQDNQEALKKDPLYSDAPIDWDAPENHITAAELGAAIIEYVRRLQMNQRGEKSATKIKMAMDDMQYKLEEQTGRVIHREGIIINLEKRLKGLQSKLDASEKTNEDLEAEVQQLRIKVNMLNPKAPKTSFKMSEIASVKNLLDGKKDNALIVTGADQNG